MSRPCLHDLVTQGLTTPEGWVASDAFYQGRFELPDLIARRAGQWKVPMTDADLEGMEIGQLFRKYGLESEWSAQHRKPSQLEPFRCGRPSFAGGDWAHDGRLA